MNKDRKQTKYGHKRREHMTHTTEDWQLMPVYTKNDNYKGNYISVF